MVLRTKTIEYPFDQRVTDLAASTTHTFLAETVYIPETGSRTILSAYVSVYYRTGETAGWAQTTQTVGIDVASAGFVDRTIAANSASTTHQGADCLKVNFTPEFIASFGAGISATVAVRFSTDVITQNANVKLVVTYQYDDTAAVTRIRTARIPLQSPVLRLGTTQSTLGTLQIPQLTGGGTPFLPEDSVVIREAWFEVTANERRDSTVDFQLETEIDALGVALDGSHEAALASDVWYRRIWRPSFVTTTTHDFKARCAAASGQAFASLSVVLYVTYEYNHTNSTRILNSLLMPLPAQPNRLPTNRIVKDEAVVLTGTTPSSLLGGEVDGLVLAVYSAPDFGGTAYVVTTDYLFSIDPTNTIERTGGSSIPSGGTVYVTYTATDWAVMEKKLFVEEPGTITLLQSAVQISVSAPATPTLLKAKIGAQDDAANVWNHESVASSGMGNLPTNIRVDSAAPAGAGLSLARGENTLSVRITGTTGTTPSSVPCGLAGLLILNYSSDKATDGDGAHAHTVMASVLDTAGWVGAPAVQGTSIGSAALIPSLQALPIPETEYYINSVGVELCACAVVPTADVGQDITVDVGRRPGEGAGHGYERFPNSKLVGDGETAFWHETRDFGELFKRHPGDLDPRRIDVEALRDWRLSIDEAEVYGTLDLIVTYHSIKKTLSGSFLNSAVGTGVTVTWYRVDTKEPVASAISVPGGSFGDGQYSAVWYDDTISLYAEAQEDATHVGRSINAIPT